MTQRELEKQISEQTGESIQTIRQLGFSPLRAICELKNDRSHWSSIGIFWNQQGILRGDILERKRKT